MFSIYQGTNFRYHKEVFWKKNQTGSRIMQRCCQNQKIQSIQRASTGY